jgi:hypothetical protein
MSEPRHLDYDCDACGASHGGQHVCEPEREALQPQPPSKPFVKRWDPAGGYWVHCMVENGKAWCPRAQRYTAVDPREPLSAIITVAP